jgi:uncharacterized surface protein with fasciclin (FAS1) repeats
MSLVTVASSRPELSTLVSAIGTAGLTQTLSQASGVTLFAPTNRAFMEIQVPSNSEQLKNILLNHVFPQVYTAQQLERMSGQYITALSGKKFRIHVYDGVISLVSTKLYKCEKVCYSSQVINSNIFVGNNVIHEINHVLV